MRENTALCYRMRTFLICYIKILLACLLASCVLACLLACLLIMEEAFALSSTLYNFFISVVNFNTAFFSCQKKIPFFSVFLHKNMGLQAAVSKTAVFSVLSITGKISRNTVFPVEAPARSLHAPAGLAGMTGFGTRKAHPFQKP